METKRICPNCRKPLPTGTPLGLCPECLIKSGFNTGTEPGNPGREHGFVPPPVEELRRLFPQLEILELIGKGGMGAVYKARQPALDRFVALKILPPGAADDAGFAERFNREARALARLNHPHIVAVHDYGQAGGQPYLLMEFVDGSNLRQVEQAGRLTPEQALAIVPQICEALQFAHNEGVVHRDIKPENVLLDKKGRVKITDFGIAKIVGLPAGKSSLTGAKDVLGTPHYMAPEQVEQPQSVDHRADIYSLGVVFYELLTGELPLGKFQPPSKKVQVDVRLDEVVLHALEKEPARRYQQASQVKTDVESITAHPASSASTPSLDPRVATQRRRHEIKAEWFFVAAVCFLLAAIVEAANLSGAARALPVLSIVAACGFGIAGYRNLRAARNLDQLPAPPWPSGSGPGSTNARTPNALEAGIIALGITVFTIMFTAGLTSLPDSLRLPLTFVCLFGTAICLLTLAGWWPAPNLGIPDSGFSRRNLHHQRELALAAILCAILSGLIPTVFYWLAPWLVPSLTPKGQEFTLWMTAFTAMLAILMGLGARTTRLGHSAFIVGGINMTIWLLFFVVGMLSERPPEPRLHPGAQSAAPRAWASSIPNSYLRAALAGLDASAAKMEAASAAKRLSEQADTFNHINELCDELQGKNRSPAPAAQDWGIQRASVFLRVTNLLHSLEETAERMRDTARASRLSKSERETALGGRFGAFMRDYAELKSLIDGGGESAASATPEGNRKVVRLVADMRTLTFEGKPTRWDAVGSLLRAVPDRPNTVLELAVTSDQITVAQQNGWFGKASALARQHGFEYASFIGIHPLGSKGTPNSPGASQGAHSEALFEVVALTSTPRTGMRWWSPDGTLLKDPPGDRLGDLSGFCRSGESQIEFAVLIKDTRKSGAERDFLPMFDPQPQSVSRHELFKGAQLSGQVALVGYKSAPEKLTCRMAEADGDWTRVATWDKAGKLLSNDTGGKLQLVRSGDTNTTCLKLFHEVPPDQFAVRLIARLEEGRHKPASICRTDYGRKNEARICALIEGWQEQNVITYELYRIPLRWAAIAGIATKPNVPPLQALDSINFTRIEPDPVNSAGMSFGPTNTVVLRRSEWRDIVYVQLATGRKEHMPSRLAIRSDMAPRDWVRSNKFDLSVVLGEKMWEVHSEGIRFVSTRDGEQTTPGRVLSALEEFERSGMENYPTQWQRNQFEAVYAFTNSFPFVYLTVEGHVGLLIVRSAASPDERIELTWKRVQGWKMQRPPSALVRNDTQPSESSVNATTVTISNLIAAENWGEMMRLFPQAVRRTDKANAVEGSIQTNTPILLEWDMSLPMAFVTGMEKRPMPEFKPGSWLEFLPGGKALAHLRYDPWPHAAWRFRLEILTDGGDTIKQLDRTLKNSGQRPPKRQWKDEASGLEFNLGEEAFGPGRRFRLSVETLWAEQDGELEENIELPLYFGLSSVDYTGMLRAEWLKVIATNAEAVLQAQIVEWPKSKWNVRLQLFDKEGKPAGEGQTLAENGGWIVSRPAHGKRDFSFPVRNPGGGTEKPKTFRLRVEAVPAPTENSTTAPAKR